MAGTGRGVGRAGRPRHQHHRNRPGAADRLPPRPRRLVRREQRLRHRPPAGGNRRRPDPGQFTALRSLRSLLADRADDRHGELRHHRIAAPLDQRRADGPLLLHRRTRDQAGVARRRSALPPTGRLAHRRGPRRRGRAGPHLRAAQCSGRGVAWLGRAHRHRYGILTRRHHLARNAGAAAAAGLPDRLRHRRRHPGRLGDRRLLHRGHLLARARRRRGAAGGVGRGEHRRHPPLAGLRRCSAWGCGSRSSSPACMARWPGSWWR